MKRLFFVATFIFIFSSLFPKASLARSGCCSHHGGVCGCGCCDGSSLSNTCAPYYPECSQPIYISPTKAPILYTPRPGTPKPTIESVPTATSIGNTTNTPEVKAANIEVQPSPMPKPFGTTDTFFSFGALGLVGWLGWKVLKWFGKKAGETESPPTSEV